LRWASRSGHALKRIRANGQGDSWSGANGQRRGKRAASLRLLCDPELPTRYEAVRLKGQLVETAQNEAMPDVKFRESIIAARVVSVLE